MFLGTYQSTFKNNNRLVLPKRLRIGLDADSAMVLSRGRDGCIWGFKKQDWDRQANLQLEIPLDDPVGREARRYFFSAAALVELDGQSRFIVPTELKQFAELKEEVVMVGAGDHFEIWQPDKWQKLVNKIDEY